MRGRVEHLTKAVRRYDRRLLAYRDNGVIHILYQGDRAEASDYFQREPDPILLNPQYVFSLTDNWHMDGKPVEWGLDPIWFKLSSMDSHEDNRSVEQRSLERRERQERKTSLKERELRNNARAVAADVRKDFAKATNDINTSILEKTDYRRMKENG